MPEISLRGCRSRPLMSYLKALGVLRAVGKEEDASTRLRWSADVAELASPFDRVVVEEYFLNHYSPTPIVSPWNGASGFFPGDSMWAMHAIEGSTTDRLSAFREAISSSRQTLSDLSIVVKPANETEKARLLRALRRSLPDAALQWFDASVVLVGNKARFPPILGTGGNDGHYDFANNYAQAVTRVLELLQPTHGEATRAALGASLFGESAQLVQKLSGAHFQRDASPVNSPTGESDALGNPWDIILAVEGALILVAGASRRHAAALGSALAAPFTARASSSGYGSAVTGEKGRDELWLPLWGGWASLRELETLTREARAQVGRRRATDGLDFARAAGELGVARGVDRFERYVLLKRAGDAHVAVPAGQVDVRPRPGVAALRSIDPWLRSLRSYARGNCPASVRGATAGLEDALFAFAEEGSPQRGITVIERMGIVESALVVSAASSDKGLRPFAHVPAAPWLAAGDDGSAEFAVAASLASLRDAATEGRPALPAMRDYLHGTRLQTRSRRAYDDPAAHPIPRRLAAVPRLARLHARRHLDAEGNARPLSFDRGLWCPTALASRVADRALDLSRVVRLLEGLALLDFRGARLSPRLARAGPVDATYGILSLAWRGTPGRPLAPRRGWAARLAGGQVTTVVEDALRRLRIAELVPLLDASDLSLLEPDGAALASALLLPISPGDRDQLAHVWTRTPTATEGAPP